MPVGLGRERQQRVGVALVVCRFVLDMTHEDILRADELVVVQH